MTGDNGDPGASTSTSSTTVMSGMRKREHDKQSTNSSPLKKKGSREEGDNHKSPGRIRKSNVSTTEPKHIFMCAFNDVQKTMTSSMIKPPHSVVETLSSSTHIVFKGMSSLTNSMQILPVFYAALSGKWLLKPSFVHPGGKNGSKTMITIKDDEKDHVYNGKELDAKTHFKSFPSIVEFLQLQKDYEAVRMAGGPMIFSAPHYQKVVILSGRSRDSKTRKEWLAATMEAGGAKMAEDGLWKTWKSKRKQKTINTEFPSLVVIVNNEEMAKVGADDDVIRQLLKARVPIFYEEMIVTSMQYRLSISLDDLLLQSFVFLKDHEPTVDPDGDLQKEVLHSLIISEGGGVNVTTPIQRGETPPIGCIPSGRRRNSRATTAGREEMNNNRKGMKEDEEKEGMVEEEEEEEKEERKGKKENRLIEKEKNEEEEEKEEKKRRGRPKKKVDDIEEKKEKKVIEKKKKKDEEKKERDNEMYMDRELGDGNLLAEFIDEIETNTGEKLNIEDEIEKEAVRQSMMNEENTLVFSQEESQPEATIPNELLDAIPNDAEAETMPFTYGMNHGTRTVTPPPPPPSTVIDTRMNETETVPFINGKPSVSIRQQTTTVPSSSSSSLPKKEEEVHFAQPMMIDKKTKKVTVSDKVEEVEPMDDDPIVSNGDIPSEPSMGMGLMSVGLMSIPPGILNPKEHEACNDLGMASLYHLGQSSTEIMKQMNSSHLTWKEYIADVLDDMPWKKKKTLRPSIENDVEMMHFTSIDLFYSFFHELEENTPNSIVHNVICSDAVEMFESEWENHCRRAPIDLLARMLHEIGMKNYGLTLSVPSRVCQCIRRCLQSTLPSSVYGRMYWMNIVAGPSKGKSGKPLPIEDLSKQCRNVMEKAFLSDEFSPSIVSLLIHIMEVDLLCAQTTFVPYEAANESTRGTSPLDGESDSQKSTSGRSLRAKKSPLDGFPLILLLVLDLGENRRRSLDERAIERIIAMILRVEEKKMKHNTISAESKNLLRLVICLLDGIRWYFSSISQSPIPLKTKRRMKRGDIEEINEEKEEDEIKMGVEITQNIERIARFFIEDKGMTKAELKDLLPLGWIGNLIHHLD